MKDIDKKHHKRNIKNKFLKNTDEVKNFMKSNLSSGKSADISTNSQKNFTSRKEKRKAARLLKKAKNLAFYSHKSVNEIINKRIEFKPLKTIQNEKKNPKNKKKMKEKEINEFEDVPFESSEDDIEEDLEKLKNQCQENWKQQLIKANEEEDVIIKQLEKKLKLKKRKSQTLPRCFADDGLDFVLDACNVKPNPLYMSDDDVDNDEVNVSTKTRKAKHKDKKSKADEKKTVESEDSFDEDNVSDFEDLGSQNNESDGLMDENDDFIESFDEENDVQNKKINKKNNKITTSSIEKSQPESKKDIKKRKNQNIEEEATTSKIPKEDIYGRLRDEDGNIITEKYIPPSQRLVVNNDTSVQNERIRKQMKGLVNRLSEANMINISNQIEELYRSHSRHLINETLTNLILESFVQTMEMPERLMMEHVMLVAVLHNNVGTEVGAYFMQALAKRFDELYKTGGNYGLGKECNNVLLLLSHLYNFKVTHSLLMFNIIERLVNGFTEKDIELLLLLFKTIGFSLRKDDPVTLKDVIIKVQNKSSQLLEKVSDSRVKFILEVILAIRNNNMRKIPNYDPSQFEHLFKIFRKMIREKAFSETELRISLEDLLLSEERGRWWVVGSAWTGRETDLQQSDVPNSQKHEVKFTNTKIIDLAQKQRMNTDIRKKIFYILMTSSDYLDAFESLLKLGLKGTQQQEIIHIIMDCCQQEKTYNPFYAHLSQRLCEYDRLFQLTIQFNVWDKLKNPNTLNTTQWSHLANFMTHLLINQALSLSVLKVIQFSDLNKSSVQFLRETLVNILMHEDEATSCKVFLRIAVFQKLQVLREGLKLFMHHFILRVKEKFPENIQAVIKQKVALAETALTCNQQQMRL